MPTGYTADIQSGKVTDFREFAMRCARAMGALVMMRDDPWDAPIPENFAPHTSYHDDAIEAAKKRLIQLETMTDADAHKECQKAREDERRAIEERQERRESDKRRYEAMLAKVRAWTPPGPDHTNFKKFMTEQLTESIDFDCNGEYDKPAPFVSAFDWKAEQIRKARRDLDYHTAERAKEIERTEGRNRWVRLLRESLVNSEPNR